jgi:hypothetical protein
VRWCTYTPRRQERQQHQQTREHRDSCCLRRQQSDHEPGTPDPICWFRDWKRHLAEVEVEFPVPGVARLLALREVALGKVSQLRQVREAVEHLGGVNGHHVR